MSVRVRFAPSPTGPLHIGGVRTALYNYLFAKKNGGELILRIEDTDQTRYVEGAEEYIVDSLAWLGINFDEGPKEGPNAPYRQSERKELYHKHAQLLIDSGKAYYAFDTSDELAALRKELEEAKVDNPSYNSVTRMKMKNSITLGPDATKELIENGTPYVIRLKVPLKEEIRFQDAIRDWVVVHSSTIDDKVLLKADGMPTYHLANIVDDHEMAITHVIRGEEWLPSAPLHILLYKAFGWEHPKFAHLPLLLKPEGPGKLSKRDGDIGDFPVFPTEWNDGKGEVMRGFREDGYLPEAVLNFLALLGWNPGTEQEIFTLEGLVEAFSLDRINKSGARFDVAKAKWFNQHYIKEMDDAALVALVNEQVKDEALAANLVKLNKDRVTFVAEIVTLVPYLFEAPSAYDEQVAGKAWNDLAKQGMPVIIDLVNGMAAADFHSEAIHNTLWEGLAAKEIKPGKVMQALRLALTGEGKGPDLMLMLEILGQKQVVERIQTALEKLGA
ncbi:glutamate--tRNA ligase [Arcticibacterium luteifluviistationis]|uniref:Glutamate--tRNA ligase n=1 Tax=Arcticibacterium luteifluviistationis TaxID=1784714 RepID=A0A2Z4G9X2_9BACT|nr:glutamate--tRNA ligase [Arcticibacterium luteifluviistationis]AWV97986.1 glutamate--tRNA ligase [Arcticibacterium luteifluviistationis]